MPFFFMTRACVLLSLFLGYLSFFSSSVLGGKFCRPLPCQTAHEDQTGLFVLSKTGLFMRKDERRPERTVSYRVVSVSLGISLELLLSWHIVRPVCIAR